MSLRNQQPIMINTIFDRVKSINSLIFIANKIADKNGVADKYTALKILYFAEVKHLKKYSRLITGIACAYASWLYTIMQLRSFEKRNW